jgi:ribosomal protein L29
MKTKELRGIGIEELKNMLAELNKDLIKQRTQVSRATSKSSGKIKTIKKTIAKIKTIIKEKGG